MREDGATGGEQGATAAGERPAGGKELASSPRPLDGPPGTGFVLSLLSKPLTLVLGALGSLLAGRLFRRVWAVARQRERPEPGDLDRGVLEVAAAAALEGAILSATRALVERARVAALAWLSDAPPTERKDT